MTLPSILVVDDEPDNFDVIEALLSHQDYRLDYVSSGHEAFGFLETFKPDVILLDVMMPGLDGVEVCQQIKANNQWSMIPIVMVTALRSKQDLARCLEAGANDFISKPVNSLELRARVQSMLRIKRQYDAIEDFSKLQRDTINTLGKNLQDLSEDTVAHSQADITQPIRKILELIYQLKHDFEEIVCADIQKKTDRIEQSAAKLETLATVNLICTKLASLTNQQVSTNIENTPLSNSATDLSLQERI
ncbi:MAG: response regulator [Cyanobacteria bacterium P01_A01_bin.3]